LPPPPPPPPPLLPPPLPPPLLLSMPMAFAAARCAGVAGTRLRSSHELGPACKDHRIPFRAERRRGQVSLQQFKQARRGLTPFSKTFQACLEHGAVRCVVDLHDEARGATVLREEPLLCRLRAHRGDLEAPEHALPLRRRLGPESIASECQGHRPSKAEVMKNTS